MPLTQIARAELEALHAEAEAFERKYADVPYNKIPVDELQAQRQRDVILWNADRNAAYSRSPSHGELYDLESRCSLNTVEDARRNELWREVYPPIPAASNIAA